MSKTESKQRWKVLARQKRWVSGATITESVLESDDIDHCVRRFTATIDGWQGWKIYQGSPGPEVVELVRRRVRAIMERIRRNDEGVFHEGKQAAERSEFIQQVLADNVGIHHVSGDYRHLFGTTSKGNGFFLVSNKDLRLDRTAFREIILEAKGAGLESPYFIYGRTCCYSGPGIEFLQIT